MIKIIFRIITSVTAIYIIDKFLNFNGFFIPINIFTVGIVVLLNIPGLISLIVLILLI